MVAIYLNFKQRCLGLGLIDPNFLKLFQTNPKKKKREDSQDSGTTPIMTIYKK